MWTWLVDQQNAATVGAIGLLLSIVGFGVTIYQLWRTQRIAEAARLAAQLTTTRFNTFSAMRECEAARQYAQKVNEAIAVENWDGVLVAYQPLLASLSNLRLCNVGLDDDVTADLINGEDMISRNCQVIERALANRASLSKGKQFSALRPVDSIVSKTFFNIERIS